MGIKDFFFPKPVQKCVCESKISICDMLDYQEVRLRVLAFESCVNLIAKAVSKCDYKTFIKGKEVREAEWYLLNVEPNPNQNSSAFFQKMIHTLYKNGEVLVIDNGKRSKSEYLAVADSFALEEKLSFREQRYTNVVIDGAELNKTFRESEVIHLKLSDTNIKPVLDDIVQSYEKLWKTAQATYGFSNGVHLKDHVEMIENNAEDFNKSYMEMLNNQVKPFLTSTTAVLPEFDGHEYSIMELGNGVTDTRDIKEIEKDIFDATAKAFNIPPTLVDGTATDIDAVMQYFLTTCIDPLLYMVQEEFNRKRYGYEDIVNGTRMEIDSSTILHVDMFRIANNVEKLIGSGFATINEVRNASGMQKSDDEHANELFITKNFAEVTSLKGGE